MFIVIIVISSGVSISSVLSQLVVLKYTGSFIYVIRTNSNKFFIVYDMHIHKMSVHGR